jgi:hypothetical protein
VAVFGDKYTTLPMLVVTNNVCESFFKVLKHVLMGGMPCTTLLGFMQMWDTHQSRLAINCIDAGINLRQLLGRDVDIRDVPETFLGLVEETEFTEEDHVEMARNEEPETESGFAFTEEGVSDFYERVIEKAKYRQTAKIEAAEAKSRSSIDEVHAKLASGGLNKTQQASYLLALKNFNSICAALLVSPEHLATMSQALGVPEKLVQYEKQMDNFGASHRLVPVGSLITIILVQRGVYFVWCWLFSCYFRAILILLTKRISFSSNRVCISCS